MSLARLLNRSGFRFVTFFAILVHSHFTSFRLPRTSAYIHQSRLTTPHTRALFRHIEPVEMHLFFFQLKSKKRLRFPTHRACTKLAYAPNLRAFSRGRSRASSYFVTTPLSPLRSTRSRLAPTGKISLRIFNFQVINHSSSIIKNSDNCLSLAQL